MPYNDPHHVVKTSAQWDERAIEFWVVPRGCLCVELTPEGKTKIKIGEGNKFYSQLPYVNDMSDLDNYYTKEEVDNIVTNINLMAIRSTDEYDTKNDLPTGGNKLGDVRFVKSSSPSVKTDPDVYLWNGSRWIYVGYELQDIDLSQYLKKDEFHELFDPVREKVEEMYPKMHTHENKNILDRIEEPYSTAEKEKLAGLENYDDTEIRELIAETGHTHPNKPVLDTITDDSLWSESDRTKFESLHNYDDTGVRNRLTDLESSAHTHSNKNILDQVTAAFTVEDKTKLDSLHNNEVFIGTDGMYGGREGLVPAPTIIDAGKFLCADGTWKAAGEIVYDFRGATASEDGTNGLVPAPLAGQQSYYLRGDGAWAKVKSGDKYRAGDGITILSGEVFTDEYPFEIYSRSSYLTQYIIYGTDEGVGEWDADQNKFVVNLSITADGETPMVQQILLDDKLYDGDYVDFARQIIVTSKQDMKDSVTLYNHPSYGTSGTFQWKDGSIGGNYYYNPGVTNNIEVHEGERYWVKAFPDGYIYADNSYHCIFNSSNQVTRYFAAKGAGSMIIEIQPGETYARFVGRPASGMIQPGFLYKLEPIQSSTFLPRISLFPGKINTINVTNTNKPSQIYVEAHSDDEGDPDDPMSQYSGIIYNDGILDVTQEDPDNLNILTFHYRDNVTKDITINTGVDECVVDITQEDPDNLNELTISYADGSSTVINIPGGSGKTYVAGDGITITDSTSFELSEDTVTNTEYFFDTQVTSSVLGRTYTKYNTEPTLGAVVYFSSGYTQPYFVGLTADSVKYGTDWDSQISPNPDHPTFEYKGVTWYYSGGQYAMRGDGTDTSGHMQKISGSYPASTEADLQNIARAIIDAADIITNPTKRISVKIGEGLEVDNNNDINVKIGDGLYFDANGAIAASGDNEYQAGEGIDIIGTTRPIDINYIRLDINNSRDNGSGGIIQFRNIRVLDNNGNSLQFSHASSIYGDGSAVEYGQNTRDESPQAMIEGRNKTCCTNFSLSKAPLKITFTLTSEISIANITSFSILTGADYITRDPISWDIYASNDGVTWYKIQEAHSPDVTTARSTWITDIPFVIPPDAVEILPGVKTITAKLGTGLSFDSNDAIELDNAIRIKLNCNNEPD